MADMLRCSGSAFLVVLAMELTMSCPTSLAQGAPVNLPRVTLPDAAELIYSGRSDDSWNTIFYFLFSRRLSARLSSDFPEGAPFLDLGTGIKVSDHVFERNETGDHPIDPMYPTFFVGYGSMVVLRDPAYPKFVKSLRTALADDSPRSALARALMQNDLWGAYDALFFPFLPNDEKVLGERRKAALDLIGRLIRKIALRPEDIRALPDNYAVVARQHNFPEVFDKNSGWMEVKWFLPRQHDDEAGYRRVTRVFVKPAHPQRNTGKFLNSLPDDPINPNGLYGVALITQLLALDSHGDPQPTRLTVEAQFRLFDRSHEGKLNSTIMVCEIRRQLLIENPSSGGTVTEDEGTPVYLSNGGSYGFAEGQLTDRGVREPVLVRLRTRCARCHQEDLQQVMTFSIARPPHVPPVEQLNPAAAEVADFDIAAKRKRREFKALFSYFR
jgi:hypothetical protein